jgi:methyl halide transferase
MPTLDEKYWSERYALGQTGWDLGAPSPPLITYASQLAKETKILIPGAGNGHEAVFLWEQGFKNTHVLDISEAPLQALQKRLPDFPKAQLIHANFFEYKTQQFEVILEQTFFCALHPDLRAQYVQHMHALLTAGGKLAGVLFNIPLNQDHPPFGGNSTAYRPLFEPYFNFKHFDTCYNSIPPRAGNELFICLEKKHPPILSS